MSKFLKSLFAVSAIFLLPNAIFAQPQIEEAFDLIIPAIALFVDLAALAAVGMTIYGGYIWIMSGGNPEKIKMAQGTLTWAIIGMVFIFSFRIFLEPILGFVGFTF